MRKVNITWKVSFAFFHLYEEINENSIELYWSRTNRAASFARPKTRPQLSIRLLSRRNCSGETRDGKVKVSGRSLNSRVSSRILKKHRLFRDFKARSPTWFYVTASRSFKIPDNEKINHERVNFSPSRLLPWKKKWRNPRTCITNSVTFVSRARSRAKITRFRGVLSPEFSSRLTCLCVYIFAMSLKPLYLWRNND